MRKEILNSIIITILLLTSVYFVSSSFVEGNGKQSFYKIIQADGNVINYTTYNSSYNAYKVWWNPYTNYSANTSQILGANLVSLMFNFTLNNTGSSNLTNITITFPNLFQIDHRTNQYSSNITPYINNTAIPGFGYLNMSITQVLLYNYSYNGLANATTGAYNNMTFGINVSVNGTGLNAGPAETTGTISIVATNASNTNTINILSFTVGVDSRAPIISNIQVSNGVDTKNAGNAGTIFIKNTSNITIYATITDANIWNNLTADRNTKPNGVSNISIWWSNSTGIVTKSAAGNQTNMTNLTSCTWAQGAAGCVFYATLPMTGNTFAEGGNISFGIYASDYFQHTSNSTGYNVTFDNTARVCEISIPDERFIVYREFTVSCDGDANTTRLYEATHGTDICTATNACSGIYSPQQSGTISLECETQDAAGNKQTCQKDITVYSRESIYASETASGTTAQQPTAIDISKEQGTTDVSTGQSTTFKYGTIDHTLKIDSITSDSVTVTIDSKISLTLPSGTSKEVDLTGDGTNDVKVTLNRVLLNKADISIEKLAGATSEAVPEVVQQKSNLAWLWWVLIGIVIIVIIYLVMMAKKKK
ncbi:MAG: hypothetical protein PHF86_13605 [Candidatus Nanoarchaeia archaeon]|nr:hypothetical protein [Candidatus Nanoarchaeia archaeon]